MKIPKEGSAQVGPFIWDLFLYSKREKERLGLPESWRRNYRLYRGNHWGGLAKKKNHVTINLFFANVQRTVANITARNPVSEVVSIDGTADREALQVWTGRMGKWYHETEQQQNLETTCLNMENYGITIEKAVWDFYKRRPDTVVVDPFAFFPAPGNYDSIDDMPYCCHAFTMSVEDVEKVYGVSGVEPDDEYSHDLLGKDRENDNPVQSLGSHQSSPNVSNNYSPIAHPTHHHTGESGRRALVVECWIRDYCLEKTKTIDPVTGVEIVSEEYKYPGGIRVITVTNGGEKVLNDMPNPNINPNMPRELTGKTYGFDHFPFYRANSYRDNTSIWGFGAAEQVGDLNIKLDEMFSRIVSYLNRVCMPPLIIPKDAGIHKNQISNKAGMILAPVSSLASQYIRYLQVPNLPSDFLNILQLYMNFFDKVYSIEDADRGEAPRGVIAASAIMTLQERNAVLIRHKIRSVDYLVRQRGRHAISFFQNFGVKTEAVDVAGEEYEFRGTDWVNFPMDLAVEAGSTMPRTSLQTAEYAKALYQMGAIDREALLQSVNFPGYKEVLSRFDGGMVDQALEALMGAGAIDQDMAAQIKQRAISGPGKTDGTGKPGAPPSPGVPKGQQG